MTRILVVDNYDSFVFTIVGYLEQLGADCEVVRNDAIGPADAEGFDGVLVSPGPGTPEEAGVSMAMIEACAERAQPMLGVCLGHQAMGAALGGKVVRAGVPMHGKTSTVEHDGQGVFEALPQGFTVVRYHSLVVERESLPADLVVTASSGDGEVMGLRHRTLPIEGVQFHPESILSEHGHAMLRNFLDAYPPAT
jgi:para-aminobenzoate synthetase component 2